MISAGAAIVILMVFLIVGIGAAATIYAKYKEV